MKTAKQKIQTVPIETIINEINYFSKWALDAQNRPYDFAQGRAFGLITAAESLAVAAGLAKYTWQRPAKAATTPLPIAA